jgi:predicted ATPase
VGHGHPVSLPSGKVQALLAILALPPVRAHARDKLATLLWGGLGEAEARASLRQALFMVRRALPGLPLLVVEADNITLDPAVVEVDLVQFERRVADGTPSAFEEAAALYRGDLLSGLAVSEPAFEEWLLTERERYRELAIEALAKLLVHQRKVGSPESAVQTGLRLLALDPLQEPVHRTLMRLYVELGRRAAALRQYQACVAAMQRELGAEPETETKQLYQEILQRRPTETARPPSTAAAPAQEFDHLPRIQSPLRHTPLIGRENELGRLRQALRDVGQGRESVIAVIGEAGIGKSRMVEEISADASAGGCRVLLGRCYESARILAFGPWVEALRATLRPDILVGFDDVWRTELGRLFPELAVPDQSYAPTGEGYMRLFEALAQLVRHVASYQPLLIVLEDLHWADEISLQLLSFLGRRLDGCSVMLAATVREEEIAGVPTLALVLDELDREGCLARVAVQPLSRADTAELVRVLAGRRAAADAVARLEEQVWKLSEGNPFMIVETMRSLRDGTAIDAANSLAMPERVRDVIARGLGRLSDRARDLVGVAAMIGREFEFPLLQAAGGLDANQAAEGVEELVRRRVVQSVGDRFDFVHDRIREVADRQVLAPRRRLLHERVAHAIETVHASDLAPHYATLGRHYGEAQVWDKALPYLRRAAAQATDRGALGQAQELFARAFTALDHIPESRETRELRFDLMMDRWAVVQQTGIQNLDINHLHQARALAESLADDRRMALVFARLAREAHSAGDQSGIELGERAVDLAERTGNVLASAQARLILGETFYVNGDFDRAISLFERNVASLVGEHLYASGGYSGLPASHSRAILATSLSSLGRFSDALTYAKEAVALAEAVNRAFAVTAAYLALGAVRRHKGDIDESIVALEHGLEIGRTRVRFHYTSLARELGQAYTAAGRLDEAVRLLEQVVQSTSALCFAGIQAVPLAQVYTLTSRWDEGLETAQRALESAQRYGHRPTEAAAFRQIAENWLRRPRPNPEAAIEHDLRALAITTPRGMRPAMAHSHLGLGRAYQLAGAMKDAATHLDIARNLFVELGTTRWLPHVEQLAEAIGGKA